ncbi:Pentatricopeptide repeat-containing protein [Camellia lanceoleosa]|uniref:Pentatricopeptide repeat-containing protein n=1 Tax=Camellia lanceoleosa TaxID=1840588 RepID=A0ACC0G043_9ERIC|nr:Pentatricopeptide repeat-containing protein [Camellia lanceoleosa]
MRRSNRVIPDKYTFPFVLKACGRLGLIEKGLEIHCLSAKLGLEFDVFVQNGLISMYFQCGFVEFGRMVFDMVPGLVRDVVTWNSVISGYVQSDCCANALKVFGELLDDCAVRPNEVTVVSALTACGRNGFLDLGTKVHGFSVVSGFDLDAFLGSSLVDMYAKCGQLEDARKVFDRIPNRNIVCWTSMIAGYVQSDLYKDAIDLFREMQVVGVRADSPTIACVISACGHSGALHQGRWVHGYCERNHIEMNLPVKNALIDMYSKCGDIEKAVEIFHGITKKDVFSWTAMISGLAMNGLSEKALHFFSQMEMSNDVRPNEVTFLGVLSACSHSGFVDKGFYYFEAMTRCYGLTPWLEHYGCMVDLLGRANLLVEAVKFIKSLPIRSDVVIWRSLLFACRSHGNVELAEFAANKIEELEPRKCGARVLLSNVYASASRWSDVKRNIVTVGQSNAKKASHVIAAQKRTTISRNGDTCPPLKLKYTTCQCRENHPRLAADLDVEQGYGIPQQPLRRYPKAVKSHACVWNWPGWRGTQVNRVSSRNKNLEIKKINDKKNASMEAQQKSLFEGFMLLKKMIYLQLKPSLHLWRLNLRLLNRRYLMFLSSVAFEFLFQFFLDDQDKMPFPPGGFLAFCLS